MISRAGRVLVALVYFAVVFAFLALVCGVFATAPS